MSRAEQRLESKLSEDTREYFISRFNYFALTNFLVPLNSPPAISMDIPSKQLKVAMQILLQYGAAPLPKYIYIKEQSDSDFHAAPIDYLEKVCGFTYSQDFVIDSKLFAKMEEIKITAAESKENARKIQHMKMYVDEYVAKMGVISKPGIGRLVLARQEIKQGTFIERYIGVLTLQDPRLPLKRIKKNGLTYCSRLFSIPFCAEYSKSVRLRHADYPTSEAEGMVDAEKFSNLSRLFPHLVSKKRLLKLNRSALPAGINFEDIATDNLSLHDLIDNGLWTSVMIAATNISLSEPIGFSYDDMDPDNPGEPGFFNYDKPFLLIRKKGGEPIMWVKNGPHGTLLKAEPPALDNQQAESNAEGRVRFIAPA